MARQEEKKKPGGEPLASIAAFLCVGAKELLGGESHQPRVHDMANRVGEMITDWAKSPDQMVEAERGLDNGPNETRPHASERAFFDRLVEESEVVGKEKGIQDP